MPAYEPTAVIARAAIRIVSGDKPHIEGSFSIREEKLKHLEVLLDYENKKITKKYNGEEIRACNEHEIWAFIEEAINDSLTKIN